jgi:hypothetical protein
VYKGVTTSELDELAAETAASMTSKHPDYAQLAARIAVSNLHKNTLKSFSETCVAPLASRHAVVVSFVAALTRMRARARGGGSSLASLARRARPVVAPGFFLARASRGRAYSK